MNLHKAPVLLDVVPEKKINLLHIFIGATVVLLQGSMLLMFLMG